MTKNKEAKTPDGMKNPFDLNTILEDSKSFKDLVVLGYDERGNLHVKTSVNNFPFVQYTLSKAQFEVNVIEKNFALEAEQREKSQEGMTVLENIEPEDAE